MTNKEIERKGIEVFKKWLIQNCRINKDNITDVKYDKKYGCDVIVKHGDKKYYFELKTTGNKKNDTNLRFTWQTIVKMHRSEELNNMFVVLVNNLDPEKAEGRKSEIKMFRFGDVSNDDKVLPEVHFIVKPKQLEEKNYINDPFHCNSSETVNMDNIFNRTIRNAIGLE